MLLVLDWGFTVIKAKKLTNHENTKMFVVYFEILYFCI